MSNEKDERLPRREFIKRSAAATAGAVLSGKMSVLAVGEDINIDTLHTPTQAGKGSTRMNSSPNILIVITHDTGRHLGCYGAGVETPNLDRMAGEGVQFRQCFCTASQCSPSRASMLTGMAPHSHGVVGLTQSGFRINPDVKTLPALLVQAGYRTNLFGLQHESPDASLLGYQSVVGAKRGERLLGRNAAGAGLSREQTGTAFFYNGRLQGDPQKVSPKRGADR